jgi:hypothetical protein
LLNHGKVLVKQRWLKLIRHKRGVLVRCDAHIGGETSVGTFKLDEAIEMPCTDLLASSQRKCEFVWLTWQNEDVSHLKIGDETLLLFCIEPKLPHHFDSP